MPVILLDNQEGTVIVYVIVSSLLVDK